MIEVRGVQISKTESRRLHLDWWGKCRTCLHWTGDMSNIGVISAGAVLRHGTCTSERSSLYGEETSTDGHCPEWNT